MIRFRSESDLAGEIPALLIQTSCIMKHDQPTNNDYSMHYICRYNYKWDGEYIAEDHSQPARWQAGTLQVWQDPPFVRRRETHRKVTLDAIANWYARAPFVEE